MSLEILNRWTNAVVYRSEVATDLPAAVIEAVASGASLDGASLDGARLDGARLVGARLVGASLDGARLDGASLVGASLDGASLVGARLDGARLDGASLVGASLDGARLDGARLDGASLVGASLDGASLDGASGLLSTGIVPLQIGGSRNWIVVRQDGHITIGCEHHQLVWWEEHYRAVGRRESYTAAQVEEYGEHLAYCRKWMERNGVVNVIEKVPPVVSERG